MPITKEALLKLADSQVKEVQVGPDPGDVMVIKRITLKERNLVMRDRPEKDDTEGNLLVTKRLVAAALVDPKVEPEELDQIPAAIVDRLAAEVIEFNGWGERGKAQVADHFRPAS